MTKNDQLARGVCRECGAKLKLNVVGTNEIGRPIRECPNDHQQAGPVPTTKGLAADGSGRE